MTRSPFVFKLIEKVKLEVIFLPFSRLAFQFREIDITRFISFTRAVSERFSTIQFLILPLLVTEKSVSKLILREMLFE